MNIGSKYEETRDLTTTEIAALIRRELRAAQKDRNYKVKVKTHLFAGGSAIRVQMEFPEEANRVAAAATVSWARMVLGQYNREDIDLLTDFFDVRFSGTVVHNLGPLPEVAASNLDD